jgi:hypothetical protein
MKPFPMCSLLFRYLTSLTVHSVQFTYHNSCVSLNIHHKKVKGKAVPVLMVLGRIFGPKRKKWQEAGEDCMMRSFIICTLRQVLLG